VPSTGPAGDAFYTAPSPLPGKNPGDLIWYRTIPWDADGTAYVILYRSTTVDGTPIAVSGTAVVPKGASPSESRPILAWAHGTTGLGDQCATSRQFAAGDAPEAALATAALQRGMVFVATDYQGLGTPGEHAYVMNLAEGRNVLDSARAAGQLPDTQISGASKVVIWGHSQGGGAAALAAELAPTYAPELNVVGAMAGAPAGDLQAMASAPGTSTTPFGYVLMAVAGVQAEYPSLGVEKLLTPAGAALLEKIKTQCADEILPELEGQTSAQIALPALAADAGLAKVLKENSAGYLKTPVPIFIYHGDADTTVPASVSKAMFDRYCAEGVDVSRTIYPGAGHVDVIASALTDITNWLDARLKGEPARSTCGT
jgi:alpha-beta hydrolase superfamily lysophospholipase